MNNCLRCKLCGLWYGSYGFERKIKKDNICLQCFVNKEKPYKLLLHTEYYNYCGGVAIYRINLTKPNVRLHHIAHLECAIADIRPMQDFVAVNNWNDVWCKALEWINPEWEIKFKGPIKKGICQSTGNDIKAIILDKKKNLYYITGVWG